MTTITANPPTGNPRIDTPHLQELIGKAFEGRHCEVVLSDGEYAVDEPIGYSVARDYSARVTVSGRGGVNRRTTIRQLDKGRPAMLFETSSGNLRDFVVQGICFRQGGIEQNRVGYAKHRDLGFFQCPAAITGRASFPQFSDCWIVHSDLVVDMSGGGNVHLNGWKFGEDVGGFRVSSTLLHLNHCDGHGLGCKGALSDPDIYPDRVWVDLRSGASITINGGQYALRNGCDAFMRAERTRAVAIGGMARFYMADARAFCLVDHGSGSGTEPEALFFMGDALVVSDQQAFTVMEQLAGTTPFKGALIRSAFVVSDPDGFDFGAEAVEAGLDASASAVRKNTD